MVATYQIIKITKSVKLIVHYSKQIYCSFYAYLRKLYGVLSSPCQIFNSRKFTLLKTYLELLGGFVYVGYIYWYLPY